MNNIEMAIAQLEDSIDLWEADIRENGMTIFDIKTINEIRVCINNIKDAMEVRDDHNIQ